MYPFRAFKYALRFAYYLSIHRSWSSAKWVMDYERNER